MITEPLRNCIPLALNLPPKLLSIRFRTSTKAFGRLLQLCLLYISKKATICRENGKQIVIVYRSHAERLVHTRVLAIKF